MRLPKKKSTHALQDYEEKNAAAHEAIIVADGQVQNLERG